jgi:hypothetical protein
VIKSNTLAAALGVLGVIFIVIAALYAFGVLQIFVSDTHSPHHYTHMILFGILAVASFIAANFARVKTV